MKESVNYTVNNCYQEIDYHSIDTLASNEIKKGLLEFCSGFEETEKLLLRLLESVKTVNCNNDKNKIKPYIEKLLISHKIKEKISKLIELIDDNKI